MITLNNCRNSAICAKSCWNTMRPSTFRVAMCSPKRCSTFPERMLQGIGNRRAREKWGHVADDDLDKIAGRREQLEGKIRERHDISKNAVRRMSTAGFAA
jgi:uncharacterized protein YjbJ (UPF0337 family)